MSVYVLMFRRNFSNSSHPPFLRVTPLIFLPFWPPTPSCLKCCFTRITKTHPYYAKQCCMYSLKANVYRNCVNPCVCHIKKNIWVKVSGAARLSLSLSMIWKLVMPSRPDINNNVYVLHSDPKYSLSKEYSFVHKLCLHWGPVRVWYSTNRTSSPPVGYL